MWFHAKDATAPPTFATRTMEAAPLTLVRSASFSTDLGLTSYQAHTHAHNASLETQRSNPVAASEEHDLAAAEFAAAAKGSNDHEAIRILNLLEQHHKKLGELLKSAHEKPDADSTPRAGSPETTKTQDAPAQPPSLPRGQRTSNRQLSSSYASELATARGIPSNRQKRSTPVSPLVSNQHADGQMTQDAAGTRKSTSPPRSQTSRPSWAPPIAKPDDGQTAPSESADSPFSLFYNTFDNLISKMSAPLAFAGLPLAQPTTEKPEVVTKTPTKAKTEKKKPMDYSHLISDAAFRAVSSNPNTPDVSRARVEDSFYHVPASGGTMSYAEIMARADRDESRTLRGHHRQISNLSNISEDHFVDAASELPAVRQGVPKPGMRRGMTDEPKVDGKTMEELALENQTLKYISDKLSRRLHVFEMYSQTSTAALAQSIRSMPRSPLMTPTTSRNKSSAISKDGQDTSSDPSDGTQIRIQELEDILRKSDARAKKKEAENEKLKASLERYRDKWETLKTNAKTRREQQNKARREGETIIEEAGEG